MMWCISPKFNNKIRGKKCMQSPCHFLWLHCRKDIVHISSPALHVWCCTCNTVVRFISLPSDRFLCNAACEKNRSALCSHSFHVPIEIFPQAASTVCFALSALLICCLLPTFLLTYHHIFTTCMIELLPFSEFLFQSCFIFRKQTCM